MVMKEPSKSHANVLVIDDDPIMRDLVELVREGGA